MIRWADVMGAAPDPTELGPRGGQRMSARLPEWMMGIPTGHVTEVPGLSRNAQLKAIGNGCLPLQVQLAVRILMDRVSR